MVQGIFFLIFPSSPMRASITRVGIRGLFALLTHLFFPFLGVGAHRLRSDGSRLSPHKYINIYIYIYGVAGVWVHLMGGQGAYARVILVLHECIWNAPAVSLVLPAFDHTGSLGSLPRQVVYPPV